MQKIKKRKEKKALNYCSCRSEIEEKERIKAKV
jgi:hypothetical protein